MFVLMCLGNVSVCVIGVCMLGLLSCVSIELLWYDMSEWIMFCGWISMLIWLFGNLKI